MSLPASLIFTRNESHGIYYSDLNASLRNSVKFDIFDENSQIATLITNNRKAYTLARGNIKLSLQRKYKWLNKWYFYLSDDTNKLVATIYVHKPFFIFSKNVIYSITFEESEVTYVLSKKARLELKKLKVNLSYDLLLDNEIKCSITNNRKPPKIYIPTSVGLEGTINISDNIGIVEILCFLQLVNIHIDLESDA